MAGGDTLTELASCRTYDDAIEALRSRKAELGLSNAMVDELIGWSSGMCGKFLGPAKVKKMTCESLWLLLDEFALDISFVPNHEKADSIKDRWERRSEGQVNQNNHARPLSMRALAKRHKATFRASAKAANRARQRALSPEKRSMLARRAAKRRWRKPRLVEITPE